MSGGVPKVHAIPTLAFADTHTHDFSHQRGLIFCFVFQRTSSFLVGNGIRHTGEFPRGVDSSRRRYLEGEQKNREAGERIVCSVLTRCY